MSDLLQVVEGGFILLQMVGWRKLTICNYQYITVLPNRLPLFSLVG